MTEKSITQKILYFVAFCVAAILLAAGLAIVLINKLHLDPHQTVVYVQLAAIIIVMSIFSSIFGDSFEKNRKRKTEKKPPPIIIPINQSGLRTLLATTGKMAYRPIENMEEAKKYEDSFVILEGDYGGQIYLVVPIKKVKCDLEAIRQLLERLDKIAWECNKGDGVSLFFERYKIGSVVPGGMGGGHAIADIWINKEFSYIEKEIRSILLKE